MSRAVLMVNLGTPRSPSVQDVRRYLNEFLKAITQTLGHLVKLVYYGLIIGVVEELSGWFFVLAAFLAVAGARSGVTLLHRWNDERFQVVSGRVIFVIAAVCVAQGVYKLTMPQATAPRYSLVLRRQNPS